MQKLSKNYRNTALWVFSICAVALGIWTLSVRSGSVARATNNAYSVQDSSANGETPPPCVPQ
jgi:hypothetical protein